MFLHCRPPADVRVNRGLFSTTCVYLTTAGRPGCAIRRGDAIAATAPAAF
jgi:hypothetical protein